MLDADGWFRTGDAGYLDADGYLFIQDRVKDMIVSGGENVYPAEVERVLTEHPDIAEVAVVGAPHPTWGETPVAYVVPAPQAIAPTMLYVRKIGYRIFAAPATSGREARRTSASASAFGPTMYPGVSTSEITGRP